MKILMLTWEFPPVVTGGLGMACYGIARALLEKNTAINLIIPSRESLYFPLRNKEDADRLPYSVLPAAKAGEEEKTPAREEGPSISARVSELISKGAGAYCFNRHSQPANTPAAIMPEFPAYSGERKELHCPHPADLLPDDDELFRQVKEYTEMAAETAAGIEFDLIHAHDWMTLPAGAIIRNQTGKPLVAHIHSTEFDRAGGAGNDHIYRLESAGIAMADRVITVSEYTARILEEKYNASRAKISVVHNAYAVNNIEKERKRIFKEPTVLFMGRITIQKGPDYFLETARRILFQEKNVRFIMAGKGDMETGMIHKSARYEMGTRFLFAGFLNRREVEEMLRAADIFVLPSVSEPFGIVCLEAMSYGTVAVISKKSGVSEIVENAIKLDFWDVEKTASTILELIRSPDRMREISLKGMAEVEKLQWEKSAEKITAVYQNALES